ncbi:hypothetical protein C7974DRAFT_384994 [Boeremia exigua]|uniref:uncharacterized protein n=1 Tax=Boeremia exigua TaxID=749465 RepID=UPI001E8E9204|nr:uncharacterized protein C7974DRAFT_384994 [Boeremia exigua]KAH6642185.1 hypothetical protein C7974DRAFT_384994 [Boeremia exigua]
MSQIVTSQTTFASGRYSKRKRTQVNYRMEEMDVDEMDGEFEEDVKPKKQRKTASSRPLPKRNIFPFLQLPAEIRNMIYTYALTDPSGIKFVAVQRNRRRCVERVSDKTFNQVSNYRSPYQSNKINSDANERAASLVPSLLATNKQIYQEGCDILYGNELVFADTVALYAFMINLGPGSASHLRKMRLTGWGRGRTSKAYNNACFAVLIWATNLEKLYIDSTFSYYRLPKLCAQQIYRDAFPWLEAVGRAKKKADAALEVLEVAAGSLRGGYYGSQNVTDAERRKTFNDELRRNLYWHQKCVMPKTKRKTKASKVSGKP